MVRRSPYLSANLGQRDDLVRLKELEERLQRLEARIAFLEGRDTPVGDDPIAKLREECRARGIAIGADDTITEADAATLLGKSKHTLRALRNNSNPLQATKPFGRVRYSVREIAKNKIS